MSFFKGKKMLFVSATFDFRKNNKSIGHVNHCQWGQSSPRPAGYGLPFYTFCSVSALQIAKKQLH